MKELDKILCEVFKMKIEELDDQITMENLDHWDSLKHMELIVAIEEAIDIQLNMDEIMDMKDFSTIRKIVKEKLT